MCGGLDDTGAESFLHVYILGSDVASVSSDLDITAHILPTVISTLSRGPFSVVTS